MWPYLFIGGMFATAATLGRAQRPALLPWAAMFVLIVLFVGLRHNVGMDWNNYLRMIYAAEHAKSVTHLFGVSEPLYALLLKAGAWSGGGMYAVNLVATAAIMVGVFAFARRTPEPWLAVMAALPMFIIVVAMSANRQALAAGLLMLLVANWYRYGVIGRTIFVFICAGFHTSAILFLVFVALDMRLPKIVKAGGVVLFTAAVIYFLQATGSAEYYDNAYGTGQTEATQSSGALIHVAMNAVPASFYFLFPAYRQLLFPTPLLKSIAFAALATVLLVPFLSAAAGRISLYWFPVSMWVWAAVPQMVAVRFRRPLRMFICALMLLLMVGWLQFANSSLAHIPYLNALMLDPWELEIGVLP